MADNQQTNCQKCDSQFPYQDGNFWICPECSHEWCIHLAEDEQKETGAVKDAHGNLLHDGDSVIVIKDLKVKGASTPVKVGTKVKNIRLIPDSADGHDIACKIDGFGAMGLKSEFVKKS